MGNLIINLSTVSFVIALKQPLYLLKLKRFDFFSYSWDFERSMFCRGNASERHRIGKLNCENEIIVDLFAGIGYFTLPYLVKANAKFVHACDWNPHAIRALR